jgi:hypothetical protein
VWKDKTDRWAGAQVQLGHQRSKIVAIGAQTMQPDDGSRGLRGRFNLYAGKQGICHI